MLSFSSVRWFSTEVMSLAAYSSCCLCLCVLRAGFEGCSFLLLLLDWEELGRFGGLGLFCFFFFFFLFFVFVFNLFVK